MGIGIEILKAYAEVRRCLRRGDLRETVETLRAGAQANGWVEPGRDAYRQGRRLAKAIGRTLALLPVNSRCLMKSLVLTKMLATRRIESVLIIAVKSESEFEAHAWVEHASRPLLPRGDFQRLVEL